MRRAAVVALALVWATGGSAQTPVAAPDCTGARERGVFDAVAFSADAVLREDLLRYLYKADFPRRADALDAGLSLAIAAQLPFGGETDPSGRGREAWRRELSRFDADRMSLREAEARAHAHAKNFDAWAACVAVTGAIERRGANLQVKLFPVGANLLRIWARFDNAAQPSPARIRSVKWSGANPPRASVFRAKAALPAAPAGLSETVEITGQELVAVDLVVDVKGGKPDAANADYSAARRHSDPTRPVVSAPAAAAAGSFILGEVRSFALAPGSDAFRELEFQGWLVADGRSLNIADYPQLYRAIGELWGSPQPGKQFNLPDLRGQFLRGFAPPAFEADPERNEARTARTYAPGASGHGPDLVGSYQDDQTRQHIHLDAGHTHHLDSSRAESASLKFGLAPSALGYGETSRGMARLGGPVDPSVKDEKSGPKLRRGLETRPRNAFVVFAIFAGRGAKPGP